MKIDFLEEPELEFGGNNRHIDIRHGLSLYGPLDSPGASPRRIRLGFVGTQATIDGIVAWLAKVESGVAAKKSRQPNLFPGFPGFGADSPFRTEFEIDSGLMRALSPRDIVKLSKMSPMLAATEGSDLLAAEVQAIVEKGRPDVVVVAVPPELIAKDDDEESEMVSEFQKDQHEFETNMDLRHLLKAKAMKMGQPIQLVLPQTYDGSRRKSNASSGGTLQDEATRAWNFHTALYYKANYRPWRIVRHATDLHTCFVGVSFYRSMDQSKLMTSMAQVYDERGEGVIVRGKPVELAKDDRQPHLSAVDAEALLSSALKEYRREHKHAPARVVMHKSSAFSPAELEGFNEAVDAQDLEAADFLVVGKVMTRLYRAGVYPPLRGTMLSIEAKVHLLYTRGSVPYYATYPGMYIPRPLKFLIAQSAENPRRLADELLALTKLNWNNTQFDGGEPITMRVAHQVGKVLKYVGENSIVQPKYSFYM
jgi:hypothetical protein